MRFLSLTACGQQQLRDASESSPSVMTANRFQWSRDERPVDSFSPLVTESRVCPEVSCLWRLWIFFPAAVVATTDSLIHPFPSS